MITIVIPCYNEATRLPATLRQMEMFFAENPNLVSDIWIVDDGSTDGTVEAAMKFRNRLPLKFHVCPRNVGKWNAISIGIQKSFGWILLLDADGAASIWELKKCSLDKGTASFGTRFGPGSNVTGKSMLRTIVSIGYLAYVKLWYGVFSKFHYKIRDFQCPFKLFNKKDLKGDIQSRRFAGDIELAMRLRVKKLNMVPIDFTHVRGGAIRPGTVWEMLLETPKIAWETRKSQ